VGTSLNHKELEATARYIRMQQKNLAPNTHSSEQFGI